MSSPVCPACGVPVVPGYVRCPKCQKPLPRRQSTIVEGGTALETRSRGPALAALAAAVLLGGGIIVYFSLSGDAPAPATPVEVAGAEQEVVPVAAAPVTDITSTEEPAEAPTGPNPHDVARQLETSLKQARLWGSVSIVGARADVRSGLCEDPAMGPLLDSAGAAFKAAGLTKLRCVEQSGRVVTDRDL